MCQQFLTIQIKENYKIEIPHNSYSFLIFLKYTRVLLLMLRYNDVSACVESDSVVIDYSKYSDISDNLLHSDSEIYLGL